MQVIGQKGEAAAIEASGAEEDGNTGALPYCKQHEEIIEEHSPRDDLDSWKQQTPEGICF